MIFGGEDLDMEVTVDLLGVHVYMLFQCVVTETSVRITKASVPQVFIKTSPDGTSRLSYIGSLYPLAFARQASNPVDYHACRAEALQTIGTRVTVLVFGRTGRGSKSGCYKGLF